MSARWWPCPLVTRGMPTSRAAIEATLRRSHALICDFAREEEAACPELYRAIGCLCERHLTARAGGDNRVQLLPKRGAALRLLRADRARPPRDGGPS